MRKEKSIHIEAESGLGKLRAGTVQFVVEEGIKSDSLHQIIDRVIGLHGCTTCGLAGIDLRFRVRENLMFEKFVDIKGVHDVIVQR